MPVITLEGSTLSTEQKRALTERLTRDAAEVMQIPAQHFVVLIKENSRDTIGVGGTLLADKV